MTAVSDFRIFPHIHRGSANQDLARWHAEGNAPSWAKVLDPVNCGEVYAASPETHALLRMEAMSKNGAYLASSGSGRQFVRETLTRCGGSFASARVYALEFMNETTDFANIAVLQANNEAALGFVEECARASVRPVVHNASFACPRPDLMHYLLPSIKAAIEAGGYFGLHAYGPKDLFAGGDYFALCWRQQLDALALAGLHVPPERVLITEFGHDYVKQFGAQSGAWRALGLSVDYVTAEYERYDAILRGAGIAGAFLYDWWTFGGNFEVVPDLLPWYNRQLAAHRATVPAPAPAPVPVPVSAGPARVTATSGLRVRLAPSSDGTVLGTLPYGSQVAVLAVASGWAKLALAAGGVPLAPGAANPNPVGYAMADYLSFVGGLTWD